KQKTAYEITVQTCALPIYPGQRPQLSTRTRRSFGYVTLGHVTACVELVLFPREPPGSFTCRFTASDAKSGKCPRKRWTRPRFVQTGGASWGGCLWVYEAGE